MDDQYRQLLEDLNNKDVNVRLGCVRLLTEMAADGEINKPERGDNVNNHIHTIYSFSPYSPAKAVWMAYYAGLATAGIMDHDSISGAVEFIKAGEITGIATTIGVECRVDFSGTALNGKRINNPDQKSNAYIALHGIPHTRIEKIKSFFAPYNYERNRRNRLMVEAINNLFKSFDISLNYEVEIIPLSMSHEGGSVTERHILFALALRLVRRYGKGEKLLAFLKKELNCNCSPKIEEYLLDTGNVNYEYDLLGVLKSDLVGSFYIEATAECPDVVEIVNLVKQTGAILAYAYLGDVGNSVTGDKKSQKFEDDYLDEVFEVIQDLGFNAVTYMPSRNSPAQLQRVKGLCERHGLFQICGEDINSPRQSFICQALKNPEFHVLIDAAWALIGHEVAATADLNNGMFSPEIIKKYPNLNERINIYKNIGITKQIKL